MKGKEKGKSRIHYATTKHLQRVIGFKVKQVEPKNNSFEAWCEELVNKAEKNDQVTRESKKNPSKGSNQKQVKAQVNIVTVSLRNPQVRDPVDTYATNGGMDPKG